MKKPKRYSGKSVIFPQTFRYFWSNYSDLTRPHSKWWFSMGNPLISGKSRLVKYYNLARYLHVGVIFIHKKKHPSWAVEIHHFHTIYDVLPSHIDLRNVQTPNPPRCDLDLWPMSLSIWSMSHFCKEKAPCKFSIFEVMECYLEDPTWFSG